MCVSVFTQTMQSRNIVCILHLHKFSHSPSSVGNVPPIGLLLINKCDSFPKLPTIVLIVPENPTSESTTQLPPGWQFKVSCSQRYLSLRSSYSESGMPPAIGFSLRRRSSRSSMSPILGRMSLVSPFVPRYTSRTFLRSEKLLGSQLLKMLFCARRKTAGERFVSYVSHTHLIW